MAKKRGISRRDQARPIVASIVLEVGRKDPKALRRALTRAYPFGERAGWSYRAWLLEIKEQIGGMRPKPPDPNQLRLFE